MTHGVFFSEEAKGQEEGAGDSASTGSSSRGADSWVDRRREGCQQWRGSANGTQVVRRGSTDLAENVVEDTLLEPTTAAADNVVEEYEEPQLEYFECSEWPADIELGRLGDSQVLQETSKDTLLEPTAAAGENMVEVTLLEPTTDFEC